MAEKRLVQRSMAFVLAGGRGSRLKELTEKRVKPALYFGGKARIIDFPLSNALNSGIRKIAIATQYKAHSLIRHCQRGWNFFSAERKEFLDKSDINKLTFSEKTTNKSGSKQSLVQVNTDFPRKVRNAILIMVAIGLTILIVDGLKYVM